MYNITKWNSEESAEEVPYATLHTSFSLQMSRPAYFTHVSCYLANNFYQIYVA